MYVEKIIYISYRHIKCVLCIPKLRIVTSFLFSTSIHNAGVSTHMYMYLPPFHKLLHITRAYVAEASIVLELTIHLCLKPTTQHICIIII